MKNNFRKIVILVSISILMFIGLAVAGKIFTVEGLPLQFMGTFLGAVVTAFITMILLIGQSQSEELKERNVKVFEEKTKHYNKFIEELWRVWEDKEVKLVELKTLTELVAQDIVPYTDKKTVFEILQSLNKISDNQYSEEENNIDEIKRVREKNQKEIYNILRLLSREIGLGGDVTNEIQNEIKQLEDKVLPVLYLKEFKKRFLEKLKKQLEDSDIPINNQYFKEDNFCYYIEIKNSAVEIELGEFNKKDEEKYISFFVNHYDYPLYKSYRETARGHWKDYLKNPIVTVLIPSFKDELLAEKMYKKEKDIDEKVEELVTSVENFYNNQLIVGNKTVKEIIEECESDKN